MKVESTFSSIGTEPITLSEAKAHLRVSNTQEDTMITRMITSAREWAERYCNRSFIDKTVTQYVSEPGDTTEFDLIHVPVATITSVKRIDKEGTATTLTLNTNYWKIGNTEPTIRVTQVFSTDNSYSYEFIYTTSASCPGPVKEAILSILAEMWEVRSSSNDQGRTLSYFNAQKMLNAYRTRIWV